MIPFNTPGIQVGYMQLSMVVDTSHESNIVT